MIAARKKNRLAPAALWAAVFVLAPGLARALPPITVAVPPGWQQVQSATAPVVLALKGPAQSSFILAATPAAIDMTDIPGLGAFLADVLEAFNRKTMANFTSAGSVKEADFSNGLSARYLKATAPGQPPLILAALQIGNQNFVGTLISNIPDLMLPAIIGSLNVPQDSKSEDISGPDAGQSSDGQLAFTLKSGWQRTSDSQAQKSNPDTVFELSIENGQISLTKAKDAENVPIAEEPDVVLQMARQIPEADTHSVSSARVLKTPAGPSLIYAAAREKGSANEFVVGYLPWGYWGYSVLARGPKAENTVRELFSSLTMGPSAIAGLVAATPALPSWTWTQIAEIGAVLAAGLTLVLAFALRRPKK